jgi:two-component system invasion response regulator UvrY
MKISLILVEKKGYKPYTKKVYKFNGLMGADMIKVVLIDDHELVRTGIRSLLTGLPNITIIGEGASGEDAIRLCREKKPNVLVMDLKMKGISGLEATRKILHHDPEIKVLILTVCNDDIFPIRLLRAGASGYLTKDCGSEEMIRAVRAVYAGQRYISPEVAQRLALRRFSSEDESPFDSLSERELQVMLMITAGKKVQDIAEKLHLSPKTVNTYRYRLFEKLGVTNDVELTHMAIQYGMAEKHNMNQSEDSEPTEL